MPPKKDFSAKQLRPGDEQVDNFEQATDHHSARVFVNYRFCRRH
jgi:hypothetical protein